MKTWHYAVVVLLLLATVGCRTDPNIAILERELRRKEDEIYRLRWAIEDLQDASDYGESRRPSESHRDESGPPSSASPPSVELPGRATEGVPDALRPPPGSEMPEIPEVPEHLRGPSGSRSPESIGPALERKSAARGGRSDGNAAGLAPLDFTQIIPTGDSRDTQEIVLDRIMTGGVDADGRPGEQGLLAVIEPRDARGRPFDAPAEMSVVLLDPATPDADGKALRIARWDYSTVEVAEQFRRNGSSPAIHLTMGLPERRPKNNKLHLFVRYVTSDGRILQDDMPIELFAAGDPSNQWLSNDADRTGIAAREPDTLEARGGDRPARGEREPRMSARQRTPNPQRPVWSPDRPR